MSNSILDKVRRNRKVVEEKGTLFQETFQLSLHRFMPTGLLIIVGFDIVEFDKAIKTPDGVSTKDWVSKNYGGDPAVKLIEWLIENT